MSEVAEKIGKLDYDLNIKKIINLIKRQTIVALMELFCSTQESFFFLR